MKSIDLHVHSTYSDGTLTPSELVKKAFSINLAAMALTDHDTMTEYLKLSAVPPITILNLYPA